MTPERALMVLGRDAVMGTVAEAMRLAHPDHGGDPDKAEARLAELKQVRDVLKPLFTKERETPRDPCKHCLGRGLTYGTFGATPCMRCGGTGEQRW